MPTVNAPLTGIAPDYPVPGRFVEINWGVGPGGGGAGGRAILLIGNKTSAGDATVDAAVYGPMTDLPLGNEKDCIARFGDGSELHRMYRRVRSINKTTDVYAIAATVSAGTAASTTITYTTSASAAGTATVWMGDESIQVPIASGDDVTAIAAAVSAKINAKTSWPVTSSPSSGVITVTAKCVGLRGNALRLRAAVSPGIGTTVSPTVSTAFTSGATADSWTTALSTILPSRYYYIVSADTYDSGTPAAASTNFAALVTQVTTQHQPITGIRQRVFAGHTGTAANAATLASSSGVNSVLVEVVSLPSAEVTPAEMAAHYAAATALFEANDYAYNFDDFGASNGTAGYWKIPAPFTQSAWLTPDQIKTALLNGVTPIASSMDGTKVVRAITTKCKSAGQYDYRVRDRQIVSVEHAWADTVVSDFLNYFANCKLSPDPKVGQPFPAGRVVTPTSAKTVVDDVTDRFESAGWLVDAAGTKSATQVGPDPANNTRLNAKVPLKTIPMAHQFCFEIDDVSSAA